MPEFIYGHWAVTESLRANRRRFEQLLLAEKVEERGAVADIIKLAQERNVPIKRVQKRILDDLASGSNHQSTLLRVGAYPYVEIDEVLNVAQTRNEKPFLLMLDLLKDPQNVGSLMRVADAVGIHGVILQDRRGVSVTPSVVNASSGAVEHLNVVQVTNISQTMKELKRNDIWMIGLDLGPEVPSIDKTSLDIPLALVLGSEGEGMRRLVRDTCDMLISLPMRGRVASLNVATVGSVALYAAWQSRKWDGWTPQSQS